MLEQLLEVLQMTPAGENRYAARNMHPKAFRVYGGQVLAQAVMAARGTVEPERVLHSQHAYFPVSYTHLTLPTIVRECRSRGGPAQ